MLRFDPPVRAELRGRIMRKGLEVATLLADVLAGKDKRKELAALRLAPGIRPEEALRMYLDLVESKRALLDDDDDRFGRCDRCQADLGEVALREMPWADRCPRCA
jgi:hypothetical protein